MKVLMSLLLCLSLGVVASGGKRKHKKHKKYKMHKMKEKLGLTDDQAEKIKAVKAKYKDQIKPLRDSKKEARKALKAAMKDKATSDAELKGLWQKVQSQKSLIAEKRFAKRLEVRSLLTAEQLAKRGSQKDNFDDEDEE